MIRLPSAVWLQLLRYALDLLPNYKLILFVVIYRSQIIIFLMTIFQMFYYSGWIKVRIRWLMYVTAKIHFKILYKY